MKPSCKLNIPEVLDEFLKYGEKYPNWQAFHIVLADGNLDFDSVLYCEKNCKTPEEYKLFEYLTRLSLTQRKKLYRIV